MELESKEDELFSKVTDTLKFHGVSITSIDLDGDFPVFYLSLSKAQLKKSIEQTLTFVYWVLQSLVYGKAHSSKDLVGIKYNIVD